MSRVDRLIEYCTVTVRDVAGFLAVDEKTIYRLTQQGKLPGFKVVGTWRFQLQDIQGWIDRQKVAVKAKKMEITDLSS